MIYLIRPKGLEASRGLIPKENVSFYGLTPPRPKGYVAKLKNLEEVRGQGCPTRFGFEGYVAKRRNGQRLHG